jgi:hypothetical protein
MSNVPRLRSDLLGDWVTPSLTFSLSSSQTPLRGPSTTSCGGLRGLPMPLPDAPSKLAVSAYLLPLGVSFRVPAAAGVSQVQPKLTVSHFLPRIRWPKPPSAEESFLPRALSPLRRSPHGASTPDCLRRDRLRQRGTTRHCLFRPRGLSPPRRLTPHRASEHVAARAGHGVHRVSVQPRPPKRTRCLTRDAHTPRRRPLFGSRSASLRPVALLPFLSPTPAPSCSPPLPASCALIPS